MLARAANARGRALIFRTIDPAKPFFQIATALIPILLVGGLIAERVRPPKERDLSLGKQLVGRLFVIAAFFFLPVLAEILAIHGAIVGHVSEFSIWVVSLALVLGTCVLALIVVQPWMQFPFRSAESKMEGSRLSPSFRRARRAMTAVMVLATGCLAALSVDLFYDAVSFSRGQQDLGRLREKLREELALGQSRDRFIREIDATERIVRANGEAGARQAITNDALVALAYLRLAAVLNTGAISKAEQKSLKDVQGTFRRPSRGGVPLSPKRGRG